MAEFLEKKIGSMQEWDKVKFPLLTYYKSIVMKYICTPVYSVFTGLSYGVIAVRLPGHFCVSFITPTRNVLMDILLFSLQYCHYVAGLVGVGLSRLFSASLLEDPEVGRDTELANSMGLFLQKTNIIRDYLEDQQEGRAFWPEEVRVVMLKIYDTVLQLGCITI